MLLVSACTPQDNSGTPPFYRSTSTPPFALWTATPLPINPTGTALDESTPLPTRPEYAPGQLVDYTVQTGDTLPALAAHFNTTVKEIREANPIIPADVTTLPPGMPMKIPVYYKSLWNSSYQILPDSLFVNGPAQSGFNAVDFVNSRPGWLKYYSDFFNGTTHTGGDLIQAVANNYSISPRLLLTILEYQTGALSQSTQPDDMDYLLDFQDKMYPRLGQQLARAADALNNGYYGWRMGKLVSIDHLDGRLENIDPWQNAASVALQYYFSLMLDGDSYSIAIQSQGFALTYRSLFGDPWANVQPHIPGSLKQPDFHLPFQYNKTWTLTGGPHPSWGEGEGEPWGALDFAPPGVHACTDSLEWVTAVADGVVVRTDPAVVMLDLDGDGDEHTGWVILYMHMADTDKAIVGMKVKAGDPLGHPSCLGGTATGTHVHVARKYNGEWIPAGGALPFNLEGWIAQEGANPYQGQLVRYGKIVLASNVSDSSSKIQSENP